MTGVMAPFPAKYAVFEFVNTLQATFFSKQCLHIAIDTKGLLHIFY